MVTIENQYFFRIKTRHKDVGYKLANKEAARIGRTAFLAPSTRTFPTSRLPPRTIIFSKTFPSAL